MAGLESAISTHDGEQHVIAAAQHIVKALAASKNLSSDVRKILLDLDTQLSTMTNLPQEEEEDAVITLQAEDQLKHLQKKVIKWHSNQSMIWDSGSGEAANYLQTVHEIQKLTDDLRRSLISNKNGKRMELLLHQARSLLQQAMERLEEQLLHILARNKKSFEPEYTSFQSCEENVIYEESTLSTEDEYVSVEDNTSWRESTAATESEEYVVDLIHPDVISDIKSIANLMFASNYDCEFRQAFTGFWRDALDNYLTILDVNELRIEDVLKMEWNRLNCRIKKWCWAMKIIVRSYLHDSKRLFTQILGECGLDCFVEASSASILCLWNFGQAISMGPNRPERLMCLLDMYEVITDLVGEINELFTGEVGSFVRNEFIGLQGRLGDSSRVIFVEFGNQVASRTSKTAFPKGGVHHLTKYVMNYIKLLPDYANTLDLILQSAVDFEENPTDFCLVLRLLTSNLEANLESKADLYTDCSIMHIFLMNNIHYMVQKVKCSDLRAYLGDEWIREKIGKFRQHAMSYVRSAWGSVISTLRDDGSKGREILKERCKNFNMGFEEAFRSQTQLSVPDLQLREDLRLSICQKLIPAYRAFYSRITGVVSDKYIKYTADDLENYILDLFEGSPRSAYILPWMR